MADGKMLINSKNGELNISGFMRISNEVAIYITDPQVKAGRRYKAFVNFTSNQEKKATAFIIADDERRKNAERLLQIKEQSNVLVDLFLDKFSLNHVTHHVLITEDCSVYISLRKFFSQSSSENHSSLSLEISFTRQIMLGLAHLHRNNVVHGCLNPKCIAIKQNQAKISLYDIENEDCCGGEQTWRDSTDNLSKKSDVFSLGLVFYYILSHGKNLGEEHSTQRNDAAAFSQMDCTAEIKNLILQMLDRNPTRRPTAEDVLKHKSCMVTAFSMQCSDKEDLSATSSLRGVTVSDSGPMYNNYDDIDGQVGSGMEDPPGQNSAYLLPGDQNKESYRIATFRNFPNYSPVDVRKLASIGFYFTGYKDRVKCFSCGITVENWTAHDDPLGRRWHKEECPMIHGTDIRNVPMMQLNLCRFLDADAAKSAQQTVNQQLFSSSGETSTRQNTTYNRPSAPKHNIQFASIYSNEQERLLLSMDLTKEVDRRKTFVKWPSYPAPTIPSLLAEDGFFYLGNLDRTQCFSCFGVLRNWAADDIVRNEHKKHFPNCKMVLGKDTLNVPLSTSERQRLEEIESISAHALPSAPPEPSEQEKARLSVRYPCNNSINPHMRQVERRLETFNNSHWPSRKIKATPRQIAIAGFFYLGEKDKCKCWYCNGGLQNWDPNDEPWTEHAKWFPGCEFVLRNKGASFVLRLYEQHPNLARPSIRNAVSFREMNEDIPPQPSTSANQPSSQSNASSIMEEAIKMGFPTTLVHDLQQRKIAATGSGYFSISNIVEDLLAYTPSQKPPIPLGGASNFDENNMEVEESGQQVLANEPNPSEDKTNLAETMKSMQNERLCKICKQQDSDVVFIPCGHLATCEQCGKKINRCPFPNCRTKIEDRIKVFLS